MRKIASGTPPYWQQILPLIQKGFPSEHSAYLTDPRKMEFVQAPESGVSGNPYAYIKLLKDQPGVNPEDIKTLDANNDGKIDIVFLVTKNIEDEIRKNLPTDINQKQIQDLLNDPKIEKETKDKIKNIIANIYRQLILHELGHKINKGEGGEAAADIYAERFKSQGQDSMLKRLVKMANRLDQIGQKSLADEIDKIIVIAQAMDFFQPFNNYNYKKTDIFGKTEKILYNIPYEDIVSEVYSDTESLHYVAEVGTYDYKDLRDIPEFAKVLPKFSVGPIKFQDPYGETVITGRPPSPPAPPSTASLIKSISKGTIKDKNSGDAFRAWMHEKHADEARALKLDPPSTSTRWDNSYVLDALRKFNKEWEGEAVMAIAKYNLTGGKSTSPSNLPEINVENLAQRIKDVPMPTEQNTTLQHMQAVMDLGEQKGTPAKTSPVLEAVSGMSPISMPKVLDWLEQRKPGQESEQLRVLRDLASLQGSSRESAIGMLASLPGGQRFHPEEARGMLSFLSANKDKIVKLMQEASDMSSSKELKFESDAKDEMQKESAINSDLIKLFKRNLSTKFTLVRR